MLALHAWLQAKQLNLSVAVCPLLCHIVLDLYTGKAVLAVLCESVMM